MSEPAYLFLESPLGWLRLAGTAEAVTALDWVAADAAKAGAVPPLLAEAVRQLSAYFAGERRAFDLPLAPGGTSFQRQVWDEVGRVPYGQALTYQAIADALGSPRATRAVGRANGQNPIPILIPCHRVVGHDGGLVGYGGGLWRKAWLLRHEGYLLL